MRSMLGALVLCACARDRVVSAPTSVAPQPSIVAHVEDDRPTLHLRALSGPHAALADACAKFSAGASCTFTLGALVLGSSVVGAATLTTNDGESIAVRIGGAWFFDRASNDHVVSIAATPLHSLGSTRWAQFDFQLKTSRFALVCARRDDRLACATLGFVADASPATVTLSPNGTMIVPDAFERPATYVVAWPK